MTNHLRHLAHIGFDFFFINLYLLQIFLKKMVEFTVRTSPKYSVLKNFRIILLCLAR